MKKEVQSLIEHLQKLRLSEAKALVLQLKQRLQKTELAEIIYLTSDEEDGAGLLTYTLIMELLSIDDDEIFWNELARDILSNNLCHYKYAYASALHHAQLVCKLDLQNVNAWEYYLDIGSNRGKILNDTDTKSVARKILELDPSNIKGRAYSK